MALGTALTAATVISTTAGNHTISFNAAGVAAVDVINTNQSNLYVCLMGYNDYANVAPVQDGDHSQIYLRFSEYSSTGSDPLLTITTSDGGSSLHYAIGSGNDDDGVVGNSTADGSVSFDTIRGDVDTTGTYRNIGLHTNLQSIFIKKQTGRGSDVFTSNYRTYLAFDGSGLNPLRTVSSVTLRVYADNIGHTNDDFGKIIAVQATALAGSTADYGNCFVADAVTVTDNATFFGANF